MEKVPKIVLERLQAATVKAAHPDADLLTAFSEHSLPETERSRVLEHLARCSACREVVALALPAEDAVTVMETRPVRNAWFTWPRMRWAVVGAGIVTVASISLVLYQGKSGPQSAARSYDVVPAARQEAQTLNQSVSQPADAETSQVEGKKAAPPTVALPAAAESNENREFDRRDQVAQLQVPQMEVPQKDKTAIIGAVRGNTYHGQQLAHGPKMPTQFQQNLYGNANTNNAYAFQSQAPASPPPPAPNQQATNQLVVAPSAAPGSNMGGPLNDKQYLDKLAVNGRSLASAHGAGRGAGGSPGAEIARAKPAATANMPQAADAGAYALNVEGSNFSPSGSLAPESSQWSINSTGGLQRSMDQGRTWQDVDVSSASGKSTGMGLQMAMKSRDRALAKSKSDVKEKPIVFRAVAANGPDVWAGGSEGNLYHSTDAGAHWVRNVPSWRGIELTGDIINLQFSDPKHGRIVTSSAEIWLTMDAGETWEKH